MNWRLTLAAEMPHPSAPLRTTSRSYVLNPVMFLNAIWTDGLQEVDPTSTGVEEKNSSTTVEFLSEWR
jgi:hypothetical protein